MADKHADFTKMATDEYNKLTKELEEKLAEVAYLREGIAPLKSYLQRAGELEKQTRKKKTPQP